MACECRPVLVSWLVLMSRKRRQMQQHREARRSLYERANGGTVQSDDEVAFPVTGYGAILDRGGTLADENLRCYEGFAATARSRPRNAQCSSRAQAGCELTPKGAAPLNVQRLVNRFVGRRLEQSGHL